MITAVSNEDGEKAECTVTVNIPKTDPVNPSNTDRPVTPTDPGNPNNPYNPVTPDNQSNPSHPSNPDTPTRITKSQVFYAQWTKVKKPGKVSSLTAKKVKKGKMKITYKKVSGAAGYEISYFSSSKFSKYSTWKISLKSTKKTLSGLWKNQTYYVRVGAYKLDSAGNKVYGSYSAKKKVKV